MENLTNIGTIKEILNKFDFKFSKRFGQNFLINSSVCPRIAEKGIGNKSGETALSDTKEDYGVLEIGAGIGTLTAELSKRAKKVVSVEIDSRLIPVLEETLAGLGNVKIINADILKVDLSGLIKKEFGDLKAAVCANLPYYITSPVIMRLLEERLPVESVTVMVQKEAADRLCAAPGTRECGAVSVAVRYFSEPRMLFPVSRGSFMPPPNVDSRVIRFNIKKETPQNVKNEKFFFSIVKAAFSQRRKTLVNPVSSVLGIGKEKIISALEEVSAKPSSRAEELTLEQWIELSNLLGCGCLRINS